MATGGDGIQVDKGGFVRVHQTILELLATAPLRGQQFRCLMFLFRKTYGFNKKEDTISLKEWADGTGMKRQNVWRELQTLIRCNVIYGNSNGAKKAMTWGFNKYHEQWSFESVITGDDKSVITYDDNFSESVIVHDDSSEKSVINVDDKSVITRSHTRDLKDNKDSSSSAAAAKSSPRPRTVSDFVCAYERIWGLQVSSPYIGEQIQEWEQKVTLEGWRYALQECTDRRNHGNWKYLRRILERIEREGYQPISQPATRQPSTLDFALEELT